MFLKAIENSDCRYFHAAPTRQQAKEIFWEDLKRDTRLFRRKPPMETELYVELMNGTRIYVIGLDRAERLEGQPWNGCHITEFGSVKPEAWIENISPVLSDTKGFAWLEGVPEGRNHFYEMALKICDGVLPKSESYYGSFKERQEYPEQAYYHWFSSDVLDAEELKMWRDQLDERTFRQEYEGSFEGYKGLAYITFGEHNIDNTIKYNPSLPVCVGMDFNVNPMTANLGHMQNSSYHQFGEIYINHSNTYEMRDELLSKYNPRQVVIYPDSTGKHESSNAQRSDLQILREAGFDVRARSKPPRVINRVNAVNSLLKSANGKTRYKINAENCPNTIRDFNQVERGDDGKLDKSQEANGLKHITDALGYLVDYNWPVSGGGVITTAA